MATMQISASDFSLSSSWSVTYHAEGNQWTSYPSTGSTTVNFAYALPTGSTINSASVWATLGSPLSGISQVKANGVSMNQKYNDERGADVSLASISGTLSVKFEFKANGGLRYIGNRLARLSFKNVYLWIDYVEGAGGSSEAESEVTSYAQPDPAVFLSPPQNVCIIDQSNQHVYLFDAVMKVQHTASVDIQEEPSKKKEQYTNSARNEPDKVSLDVIVSDVYTDKSELYNDAGSFTAGQKSAFELTKSRLGHSYLLSETWSRSQNAYYTLHNLKSSRNLLSVVTPHYVYTDMIISTITATWDDTSMCGLIMQIELQGTYEVKKKVDKTSSVSSSEEQNSTPSLLQQLFSFLGGGTK